MLNCRKIIFKLVISICLCALVSLAAGCSTVNSANSANSTQTDARVSLVNNQVSFVPPAGFQPLAKEQYQRNLPENAQPLKIFGNETGSAFVRIHIVEDFDFETVQLVDIQTFDQNLHKQLSGWLTSEITEIKGRKWFHFETVSQPVDDSTLVAPVPDPAETASPTPEVKDKRPFRYREYSTIFNKKLLRFVFESEAETYSQIKDAFNKSIQTIEVKELKSN